jgi:hypothetical protein
MLFDSGASHSSASHKPERNGKIANAERLKSKEHPSTCPTCAPPTAQVIYAPLIDVPDAFSSEIVLNCRSSHDLQMTPTFYTLEGSAIVGEVFTLHPAEIRFVDTKSLIPPGQRSHNHWGGMSLSYNGNLMEGWAQLTLKGIRGGGSASVFFAPLNLPRPNNIESVWWMPNHADAVIALGNSSNQLVHAHVCRRNWRVDSRRIYQFAEREVHEYHSLL